MRENLNCIVPKENMAAINAKELKYFSLKRLNANYCDKVQKIRSEQLELINNAFKTPLINYSIGDSYHCNEANYANFSCYLYFGFIRID
jgi:hypothetical protein